MLADPSVVVHVGGLDVGATVVPITDPEFRRTVFTQPETSWYSSMAELEELVETSPMIEVILDV